MSDPRLQSVHLESQSRREMFRAARRTLEAACGSQTLTGNVNVLTDEQPFGIAPAKPDTRDSVPNQLTFYLKDGLNVYPLHFGMNSIGRLSDNDVILRDECISRRHCAVVIHSDLRCELYDVASKNGTFLNGQRITAPTPLQSGDQITLCNRNFTFHIAEAAPR